MPPTIAPRPQPRNSLECMEPVRRGSFRQRTSPIHAAPPDRPPLAFCRRRLSWPEVDPHSTSGAQDTDNSYFETFTALSWKRENQRMSAIRSIESRAEVVPDLERESANEQQQQQQQYDSDIERPDQKEQLYIEVLYTIVNIVGAPAPGGQYNHFKEEMFQYAQRAFGVTNDRHKRLMNAASEEKPKIIVLSVVIQEAEGLEAKDANGFSDPYCMLGIQPAGAPISPLPPPLTPNAHSQSELNTMDNSLDANSHEKLRKHHSFRLSFKRKEANRRENRGDSIGGPVPAKFIRATSIKQHTLCPKWNEKFKL